MKANKRYHKLGKTRFFAVFHQTKESAVGLTYVEEIIRHRHQDIPGTDVDNSVVVGFTTRRQRDRAVEVILNSFKKMTGAGKTFAGLPTQELRQIAEYCWEHYVYVTFPIIFIFGEQYSSGIDGFLTRMVNFMTSEMEEEE